MNIDQETKAFVDFIDQQELEEMSSNVNKIIDEINKNIVELEFCIDLIIQDINLSNIQKVRASNKLVLAIKELQNAKELTSPKTNSD